MDAPRILGVDPGSECTGWALVGGTALAPRVIDCGEIRASSRAPFPERLAHLRLEFARIVEAAAPSTSAVESPFHGTNARSALQLAHARGVILSVLAEAGVCPVEYAPATVKKTVSGSGRADKDQVRAMVARLTGVRETSLKHDVADAIAVALCHQACMALDTRR